MTPPEILAVERLELRFEPRAWAFADDNRAAIDAHFAAKQKANPALWNGRVLLAHEYGVTDGVCRGAFLETDFASFNAWRDWGRPPADIVNCFAAAALRGERRRLSARRDGRPHRQCRTDLFSLRHARSDRCRKMAVSILSTTRGSELKDETGLDFDDLEASAWLAFGPAHTWAMVAKVLNAREPAEALRRRILGHLASQPQPELADIRIVRGPGRPRPDDAALCFSVPPPYVALGRLLQARPRSARKGAPGARVNGRLTKFRDPWDARS